VHLVGRKLGLFRPRRESLGCGGLCGVWIAWFVGSPPPGGHVGLADPGIHSSESVCFLRFWLHFVFIRHIHFSYIAYSENAAKTVRHLPSKTTPYPAALIYSRAFSWSLTTLRIVAPREKLRGKSRNHNASYCCTSGKVARKISKSQWFVLFYGGIHGICMVRARLLCVLNFQVCLVYMTVIMKP
jgi:hypothetical protein